MWWCLLRLQFNITTIFTFVAKRDASFIFSRVLLLHSIRVIEVLKAVNM